MPHWPWPLCRVDLPAVGDVLWSAVFTLSGSFGWAKARGASGTRRSDVAMGSGDRRARAGESGGGKSAGQTGHRADAAEVDVTTLDEGDPHGVHVHESATGARKIPGPSSIWTAAFRLVRTTSDGLSGQLQCLSRKSNKGNVTARPAAAIATGAGDTWDMAGGHGSAAPAAVVAAFAGLRKLARTTFSICLRPSGHRSGRRDRILRDPLAAAARPRPGRHPRVTSPTSSDRTPSRTSAATSSTSRGMRSPTRRSPTSSSRP